MMKVFLALAGLATLAVAPAAQAANAPASATTAAKEAKAPVGKTGTSAKTAGKKRAKKAAPAPKPPMARSEDTARVADWVASSGDNRSLPYVIVDKKSAAVFLFNAKGELVSEGPALVGIAPGDDATPGVGAKSLSEIGPAEKTTPAGRFLARFGWAAGRQRVLWVDYATSVALHTIPPANKEHRRDRMLSPTIEDNRITFGCINVPVAFYGKVRPLFEKKGGYVYVLPDTKPIEEVFPRLRVQAFVHAGAS